MRELFEMIINARVPPPKVEIDGAFLLQVNNLDYSDYLGRMFGGKVLRGTVKVGDRLELLRDGQTRRSRSTSPSSGPTKAHSGSRKSTPWKPVSRNDGGPGQRLHLGHDR